MLYLRAQMELEGHPGLDFMYFESYKSIGVEIKVVRSLQTALCSLLLFFPAYEMKPML